MRVNNGNTFSNSELITLKNNTDWLKDQRIAGDIAARALLKLEWYVQNKTYHSMKQLNDIIEDFIEQEGGSCTFKGYKGFPAGVCISKNKQLVHGIPDDTTLEENDIISFDLGVSINGVIADTAISCIFGQGSEQNTKLVKATEECLYRGIQTIKIGKRLGSIGNAIDKCAKNHNLFNIVNYGGHSLDYNIPHASPFVSNEGKIDEGIRMVEGFTLCIEPMLLLHNSKTWVDEKDQWTVWSNSISAHFEHCLYLHSDHIEILTYRGNETYLKSNKVYY